MFRYCSDIKRLPESSIQQTVHSVDTFNCEFCDKGWESETEVVFHKKLHSDSVRKLIEHGTFVCWTCIKTYTSKEELCKHIRSIHFLSSETAVRVEREIFICDECECVFFNKEMLIVHIVNYHKFVTESRKLHCPKCFKVSTLQNLKPHFNRHLICSMLSCPICYKTCRNWSHFENHITDEHAKYLYCTLCDITMSCLDSFNKHCEEHQRTTPNVLSVKRKDCVKRFFVPKEKQTWKYRKFLPYAGLRLQNELKICILCREICQNKRTMVEHLMKHTKIETTVPKKISFVCECGELFNYKILLKQHQTKCKNGNDTNKSNQSDLDKLVIEPYVQCTKLPFELGPDISITPISDRNSSLVTLSDLVENNEQNASEVSVFDVSGQVDIVRLHEAITSEPFPHVDDKNCIVMAINDEDDNNLASTSGA